MRLITIMSGHTCVVIASVITVVGATYCSPSLHTDQISETRDPSTGEHVTRLTVSMSAESSLCLATRDGQLSTVLTLLGTRVNCHVKDQYQYTVPQVSVSCYCTCSPSVCQVPRCSTCYNLTSVSPPCSAPGSGLSTTCCSLRVTTPHPALTALQLGHCSEVLQYRLQTRDAGGHVRSEERRLHLRSGPATVQHEAAGVLVTMDRARKHHLVSTDQSEASIPS